MRSMLLIGSKNSSEGEDTILTKTHCGRSKIVEVPSTRRSASKNEQHF